jgi:CubicO group peptidase (beta-lactamase class C family)
MGSHLIKDNFYPGGIMPVYRICLVLVLFSLCFFAAAVGAQQEPPEIPDTPSGQLLGFLLKALNSGEEEQWKGFIQEHWKEREGAFEDRLEMMRRVYGDIGGADIYRIGESKEYSISALLKAKKPHGPFEWIDIVVMADTLPPHKLDRVSLRPGEEPGFEVPGGEMTEQQMLEFLDGYIDNLIAKDKFSGTVLIAKDGQPFYTRVSGEACKRYGVPNKLDTKFNLGSMNKMFTGVAIMQLVEQGKLSVDDRVGKYLPDIPRKEIADNVTIHQLLTHTSGMQDYWEEVFDAHWWEIKTVEQMGELIFDDSLLFEPGAEFHYSNSGPILLGMIIEKITGQDYFEYILENICKPAGMINTDCYEMDRPVPNLAIGYTKMTCDGTPDPEGRWHNNLFLHVAKGGPAGGGYSTVEDLLSFDIALRQNKLISKESFDILTTGKVDRRPGAAYAYLFMDKTVSSQRIVGHGGGAPGINANLDIYLDSGYTVAVMANYDGAASSVAGKVEELLTR